MNGTAWTHPAYGAIGDLVRERSGLAFVLERPAEFEAGVQRAMKRARECEPASYLSTLRVSDAAVEALVDEIIVGETYFFREPQQFDVIRAHVLPPLRHGPAARRPLRAWSAGCATGEEAWSLAMLFEREGFGDRASVLGTDISRRALAAAERGVYRPWSLRACDDAQRAAFFLHRRDHYEVAERYRHLVSFRYLNLAADAFPSLADGTLGLDLILCRNVLIYLDRETVRRAIVRFHEALIDGGWLILGSSDPMASGLAPFQDVVTPQGVFYRKEPHAPAVAVGVPAPPPRRSHAPAPARVHAPGRSVAGRTSLPSARSASPSPGRPVPASDPPPELTTARAALAAGDYALCLRLVASLGHDLDASLLALRATAAERGPEAALARALDVVARHPLSVEGHFLYAALLAQAGRDDEADGALRRVLYLDRSIAVAHVLRAALCSRRRDAAGARRAWEGVRALCASLPPDASLPFSDGESAGALAAAAEAQLAVLDRIEEAS